MNREEKLKKDLGEFAEEIILETPEWAKERRLDYLISQGTDLVKELLYWLSVANQSHNWWREAVIESVVEPEMYKFNKIMSEIDAYCNPKPINYNQTRITEDDIKTAREYDCSLLVDVRKKMSGRSWAICPFHDDSKPSLILYPDGKGYYCFVCNQGGDAIDLDMKLNNHTFKESVRHLTGKY